MKPTIDGTRFGGITIAGRLYEHDVLIRLDGQVKKRKKKLSKRATGTSHVVSFDEARHIFQPGAARLIIGTGQYGALRLSEEAQDYLRKQNCGLVVLPTPEAADAWNQAEGPAIAMFHVTC